MFLSKEVLRKAYRGMRKIHPIEVGKSRQERVSALRHFFAAAKLIHLGGSSEVSLEVGSKHRDEFVKYVGDIVSFDGGNLYTKDFGDLTGDKKDYAVRSNFFTTRLEKSRNQTVDYPGRPAPLLLLQEEKASILDDAYQALVENYGLDRITVEFSLWLTRFVDLGMDEANPDLGDLLAKISQVISSMFPSGLVAILLPSKASFESFFKDYTGAFLSETKADLSDLVTPMPAKMAEQEGDSSEDEVLLLDVNDPVLQSVKRSIDLKGELNFLFFGAPGTGKTYYASKIAISLVGGDEKRVKFIQFHPSVSYDDFVEGFVPEVTKGETAVTYRIQEKHFLELSGLARNDPDNIYVLVIDEISRGDPSRIFGELLTYIESSYRSKEFTLIYSRKQFSVPENLILIATANPYDRSVGEMDDAFLRRFCMIEFLADAKLLKEKLNENNVDAATSQKIVHLFEIIEEKMPFGFGHAQFFNLYTEQDMRDLWSSKLSFLLKRSLQFENSKYSEIEQKFHEMFDDPSEEENENGAKDA